MFEPAWYRRFAERHPYWTFWICITLIWLPSWTNNLWDLFYDKPIVPTIRSMVRGMTLPEFSPYFITVPVAFAMFLYLIYAVRNPVLRRDAASKDKTGITASLFTTFQGFERAFDFKKAFDSSNKVYAFWLSGEGVIKDLGEQRVLGSGAIAGLLLPDPKCIELRTLLPTLGDGYDYESLARQIESTTRLALKNNVPIRWTKHFFHFQVTLVNPEQHKSWAHFELTLPYSQVYKRLFGRVEGPDADSLIKQLHEWHKLIWNDPQISYQPTIEDEKIALREAATIAYEQLRECESVYSKAAEKMGRSPMESRAEGTLGWFEYFLPSRIPLYGKHPPSRKFELIDSDEFKRGGFEDGGKAFHYFGEKEPKFTDLMVNRADLNNLIESIRYDKLDRH